MYDLERIKREYSNYISRLIYFLKQSNFSFNDKNPEEFETLDYFKALNLLTVDELADLINEIEINSIDFYDQMYGFNSNNNRNGTSLLINSIQSNSRYLELNGGKKFMRYSFSTFNNENKKISHINISEIAEDGIYALVDGSAKFMSLDSLKKEYENRVGIQITFDEFVEFVAANEIFGNSINHLCSKIEIPSDSELLKDDLKVFNKVFKEGPKKYFISNGCNVEIDSNYDYKPIDNQDFYDIRDEVSNFKR